MILVVFFIAGSTLMATPEGRGDLYILSVGLDGPYHDYAHDINAQDALYVRQALVAGEGFYRHVHSRALLGPAATRDAVLEALDWLAGAAKTGDVVIAFFACHGSVKEKKYRLSLAKAKSATSAEMDGLWGHELIAAIRKIKGQPILLVDSCYSGSLIPSTQGMHPPAMIVSCAADAVSTGQLDRPDRPSGFFVIALCEALSGLADSDHDRIVTIKELGDYLPARARAFFEGQSAMVVRQAAAESIPLARINLTWPPQQLLTPALRRNPFGWPDVSNPDGADVHAFAAKAKLDGGGTDPNAVTWPAASVATSDTLDGTWASRWNKRNAPKQWALGTAEVRSVRDRVYIFFQHESGVKHLIEAVRDGDRLVGRYYDPLKPQDSTPWVGRIIDHQRIDGEWGEGRWDFRRRFASGQSQ